MKSYHETSTIVTLLSLHFDSANISAKKHRTFFMPPEYWVTNPTRMPPKALKITGICQAKMTKA
jgi:hypothetical protein